MKQRMDYLNHFILYSGSLLKKILFLWPGRMPASNQYSKKGDRLSPDNYRPVSLTSTVCKLLESIFRDQLMDYFRHNNLFCRDQHGFLPGHSCVGQLLTVMKDWTRSINSREETNVIFLDFKMAFNCVPHGWLLIKLKAYGINGSLLEWLQSFLYNRHQCVKINRITSTWSNVLSGVS